MVIFSEHLFISFVPVIYFAYYGHIRGLKIILKATVGQTWKSDQYVICYFICRRYKEGLVDMI